MMQPSDNREFLPADQIKRLHIMNPEGEDLGEIDEFYIDLEYGRVAYAVVSLGGFMGMGGKKHHAIPWQAFSWSPQGTKLVLDIDKDDLMNSPEFNKGGLGLQDRQWVAGIFSYFGLTPYWEQGEPQSRRVA